MSNIDPSDSDRIALLERKVEKLERILSNAVEAVKSHPLVSKFIDLTKIEP